MIKYIVLSLFSFMPIVLNGHSHGHEIQTTGSEHESIHTDKRPLAVVAGWGAVGQLVSSPIIGSTHGGIAVDKAGLIYVSSSEGIYVFDSSGAVVKTFLGQPYKNIHSLFLDEEQGVEYLYGARNNNAEALKMNTSGEIVLRLKFPSESGVEGTFKPTAIAVKPDGHILIADGYGTNRIYEFDAEGNYLSYFGGKDAHAVDKFKTPHGLTIDKRYEPARILISDREKRRLVHFTLEGEFIGEVMGGLRRPCAASICEDGRVAIAELQGRVTLLDKKNQLIGVLGDNPNKAQWANFKVAPEDWKEGIFTAPHGLAWDNECNLYVQDWNATGRISKWVKSKN
ncbi:MAG: 6-bladed beta-propeller [Coraliomargaritaceae bacterium]